MFKILSLENEVFGLDINDLSVKVAKLKKKHKGFVLVSSNEVRVSPGVMDNGIIKKEANLIKNIKDAYETAKGEKIKTKYVVVALPEEKSFLQVIQMPKMTDEELKLAVPFEAENYIPMPSEDVYLDFQVIPQVKDYLNYYEVLIVATPKKIVDSYISCIKKAGLIPVALETESGAISRALVKQEANSSLLILIDFGENHTNLVIYSGRSIRFTCSIPISSQMLTEAIAESLKVGFHEADKLKIEYGLLGKKHDASSLARAEKVSQIITPILEDLMDQIKKYINFYRGHSSYEYLIPGGKQEKILLCGGGAELKGLIEFMSKKMEIPVELGDPMVNFSQKKQDCIIKKDLVSFATAIGLALRQSDNK